MVKVFVLAGGQGTRLHPITYWIPKCLIPVAGKPCVRWIVERLIDSGLEVVLCINRWAEKHFKHEFRDLKVLFSVSEEPLGTAGELFTARNLIDDTFMVIYGDDLTFLNYRDVLEFHKQQKADATLVITRNVPLDVGIVEIKNGRVVEFMEKPKLDKYSWTGIAVFEPMVLKYLRVGYDLARNVIPKMINDGLKIASYIVEEEWIDIGIISHLRRANEKLSSNLS